VSCRFTVRSCGGGHLQHEKDFLGGHKHIHISILVNGWRDVRYNPCCFLSHSKCLTIFLHYTILGGMGDTRRIRSFFLLGKHRGEWDPSLLILFASALSFHLINVQVIIPVFLAHRPLVTEGQSFTERNTTMSRKITSELVIGSLIFGVGWGISGLCPLPGVIGALDSYSSRALLWTCSMLLGMAAHKIQDIVFSKSSFTAFGSIVSLAVVGLSVLVFQAELTKVNDSLVSNDITSSISAEPLNYILPVIGGSLIGLASSWDYLMHGSNFGVSGKLGGFVSFNSDVVDITKRAIFILGVVAAVACCQRVEERSVYGVKVGVLTYEDNNIPFLYSIYGGALVGFGTSLGSGCTTGHGICGTSRLSTRSYVAVACFFTSAFVTFNYLL
jgi:uncharacterized membrane protein YedE/YeeE